MKQKNFFLLLIIIVGSLVHIGFFSINEILKNADSFAYLQMSYYFKQLNLSGFGTGWFGFLYSFFISIFGIITFFINEYYSALLLNIILFGSSAYILYKIGEIYLEKKYNLLLIILYYLSPILLSFNITILSENIYILIFLGFILFLLKSFNNPDKNRNIKFFITISIFLALLYFTRAEAFIYIGSVFILLFFYELRNHKFKIINNKIWINIIKKSSLIILFFLIFISPYIFYLHSITGEWGLTNKGSANLRQAELRGTDKMDDEGFEKAVGELTNDNHNLKSGFVGGLTYNLGEKSESLKEYLLKNPKETTFRILENQLKLYLKNIPELIVGDSMKLFYSKDSIFYKNYIFILVCTLPLLLVLYGLYKMFKQKEYDFLIIFFSFFSVASIFFTLFFVLNRYFLFFLPLILIILVFGLQNIKVKYKETLISLLIGLYLLGNYTFYNSVKNDDYKYQVKKIAGEWLKENKDITNSRIMERFPIVTYYSGTKERWLTPFTDDLNNLIEYAKYNNINYFVVDSLDFKTYRPNLIFLLSDDFKNNSLIKLKTFKINNEKVILYKFNF
nr:hypothetical protein [Candidatus Gracilibacteria bacterium]